MTLTADPSEMMQIKTASYRPPMGYKPSFLATGLPPFTLRTVEWMRRDPQLKLGMAIKTAPYHKTRLTLKGDPEVVKFMGDNIRRFWTKALPKVINAFWYTLSGGEVAYKENQDGYPEFWSYQDIYPQDIFILSKDRIPLGISVRSNAWSGGGDIANPNMEDPTGTYGQSSDPNGKIYLYFPKGFLYIHKREFNSMMGASDFEAAYDPWIEKNDWQGAKHSRKLWFYKNAFNGGIMFHPPGDYITPTGEKVPYETIARQAMETSMNGAVWCIAQKYDDKGNPMWKLEQPTVNAGGAELINYVQQLDIEMLRGLEIPDDVVQQVNTSGGSFSGRTIPLMAFFISQEARLDNLFNVCDEQVFRPLCKVRFGHDRYEASMDVDIDRLMGVMNAGEVGASGDANQDSAEAAQMQAQGIQLPAGQPSNMQARQMSNNVSGYVNHIANDFNGTASGSCRIVECTDMRGRVYMTGIDIVQMSAQHEQAGTQHINRSGKTSKGGQFTDGQGGKKPTATGKKSSTSAKKKSDTATSMMTPAAKKPEAVKQPPPMSVKTKSEIAKIAHVMVDKTIQRYAEEHNEARVAKALGGVSFPNGEPADIAIGADDATHQQWADESTRYQSEKDQGNKPEPMKVNGNAKHGIELKTVVKNSNNKITMDSFAQIRKLLWEKERNAVYHTVVIDDSNVFNAKGEGKHNEKNRVVYYRRGVAGSARLDSLYKVEGGIEGLKALLDMPENELPDQAKRTDGELRNKNWEAYQDEQGRGFIDRKSKRIVRVKK